MDINNDLKKMKNKFKFIYCCLIILFMAFILLNSYFKEDGKEHTIFLFLALISYMFIFITAFINNVKLGQPKKQLTLSAFCFLPNVLFAFLFPYIKLDLLLCIYFTTNLVFGLIYLIFYTKYKITNLEDSNNIFDPKIVLNTFFPAFIVLAFSTQKTYVETNAIFIYSLYISLIIFAIYSIFSITIFKKIYTKWLKTKLQRISAFVSVLIFTCMFTVPAIEIINTTNQVPITQTEYVIIGKTMERNIKNSTTYYVFINKDNNLLKIKVPHKTYESKSEGDKINIKFYNGNLNLKYYNCEDWENEPAFNEKN